MDMEHTVSDPLVDDYLRRLDAAAAGLPPDRREDLLGGIREHIDAAVTSGEVTDEASLRALLDRIGEPEEIVAAAAEPGDATPWTPAQPPAPTVYYRRPGIGLETAAVLLLTLGSLLFVVGWLAGIVMVWSSRRWTLLEKLAATLVFPGGPGLVLWLSVLAVNTTSCTSTTPSPANGFSHDTAETCTTSGFSVQGPLGAILVVAWLLLPLVVAGVLLHRARRRADAEAPIPVYPGTRSRWGGLEIAAVLLLSVGGFVVPIVAPVAGLFCAWMSDQWTRSEKWVATAIASLGAVAPLVAFLALATARF
jgi:hypothetical protein